LPVCEACIVKVRLNPSCSSSAAT